MSQNKFAAEIVRSSAGALAGFAAAGLLDRNPEIGDRYGRRAHAAWKGEFEQMLADCAAALGAESPALFASQIVWLRDAFHARDMPDEDLRAALEALRDTLASQLPAAAQPLADETINTALEALERPAAAPAEPSDASISGAYLLRVLEGDRRGAFDTVLDALRDGNITPPEVYTKVLIPAQRRIGEMWHAGEVSIAEEHFATTTTQSLMAIVVHQAEKKPFNGKVVLTAGVAGDAHEVGIRAVSDLFEIAGWRVVFVGANTPPSDVADGAAAFNADLVVISAALPSHLPTIEKTIDAVQAAGTRARILVGGGAFGGDAELAERLGADGFAAEFDEAVAIGARLIGA